MALSRWRDVWRRFTGRGAYPHELAFLLANPLRRLLQSPEQVVARMVLAPGARVLEIGPGPGYFSPALARAAAPGRLVLYDLQREMLAKARRRLERARIANACFAQGDGARLPFRAGSFDAALLVAVLGEVPDPRACAAALHRVLRAGGLLSLTETIGDPDALSESEASELMSSAGFELSERFHDRVGFTAHFRARAAQ